MKDNFDKFIYFIYSADQNTELTRLGFIQNTFDIFIPTVPAAQTLTDHDERPTEHWRGLTDKYEFKQHLIKFW